VPFDGAAIVVTNSSVARKDGASEHDTIYRFRISCIVKIKLGFVDSDLNDDRKD